MGEQSQEIRGLLKDIATSNLPDAYYANDGIPQAVTLLVGDSVLRDVRVDKTPNGIPIKIRRKSGATLADIEQMVDDAAKTETIDTIFIVGDTHETTSDVSVANIKQKKHLATTTEAENLDTNHYGERSSVLPSKRRANPDRRADVNMKVKEACNEVDVNIFVNNANFTF